VHIIARFRTIFGATFRVTRGYLKVGTSFLKDLKIIDFIEANRNFIYFFSTKRQANIVNNISAHAKSTY
jgi:hypothetical protein